MQDENQSLKDESTVNTNKIYVKVKDQLYTFEKATYNEDLLSNIISRKDYEDIIEHCGKIMGLSWTEKRNKDQIKIPGWIIFLSVISVLLTIAYMILLYLSTTVENGTVLFVISIICIAVASIIIFGMSIYNFCRQIGKFQSLDEIIKENLNRELIPINAKYSKLYFEYDEVKKQLIITVIDKNDKKLVKEIEMKKMNSKDKIS